MEKHRSHFLSTTERDELFRLYRSNDNVACPADGVRAHVIIRLDEGKTFAETADICWLDIKTVIAYFHAFQNGGRAELLARHYQGRPCKLTDAQQAEVRGFARKVLCSSVKPIVNFIAEQFQHKYSEDAVQRLLHRLGFTFYRPDMTLKVPSIEKQAEVIATLNTLLNDPDVQLLFGDAVHPTHQTRTSGAWIHHDDTVTLPESSGRERVNIVGLLDAHSHQILARQHETVSVDAEIALLEEFLLRRGDDPRQAVIVLDNARYHHAIRLREWLDKHPQIRLFYLPPYCPHLNLIERVWRWMYREAVNNRIYERVADMAREILLTLETAVESNAEKLAKLLSFKFPLIAPVPQCRRLAV
jgi:transposase